MNVRRCRCGVLIQWLVTGSGRRAPFHYELVPVESAPDDAWAVVRKNMRGHEQAVVVPLKGIGGTYRESITRALIRHDCPLRQAASAEGGGLQ